MHILAGNLRMAHIIVTGSSRSIGVHLFYRIYLFCVRSCLGPSCMVLGVTVERVHAVLSLVESHST